MYTVIIAAIMGMGVAISYTRNDWMTDFIDYVFSALVGILLGGAIGLAVAMALPMDTYQKRYSVMLESLQDNNNVSCNFFLGCGQIEGKMKYVYYYKSGEFYRMAQVDYNLVDIRYSTASPKVNIIEKFPTESFINKFAFDIDCNSKTYIIDVPKGTIQNNYVLDAQ